MARKISNKRNSMYLSVLIVGYISCIISLIFAYTYKGNNTPLIQSMYFIFGLIFPIIAVVCIFFPQIEVYTGKTYTIYSHIILGLEIGLVSFTIITMFLSNPTL